MMQLIATLSSSYICMDTDKNEEMIKSASSNDILTWNFNNARGRRGLVICFFFLRKEEVFFLKFKLYRKSNSNNV